MKDGIILFLGLLIGLQGLSVPLLSQSNEINEPVFTRPDTTIFKGQFTDALWSSMHPDNKYVGVLVMIAQDYAHSVDDLVLPIKSYFDHYEIPAFLVKYDQVLPGKSAMIRLYIGGDTFKGDLSLGDISLYELQNHHEDLFQRILNQYREANDIK